MVRIICNIYMNRVGDKLVIEEGYGGSSGFFYLPVNPRGVSERSEANILSEDNSNSSKSSPEFINSVIEWLSKESDEVAYQFINWDVSWWGFGGDDLKEDVWNAYSVQDELAEEVGLKTEHHKIHFGVGARIEDGMFIITARGAGRGQPSYWFHPMYIGTNKESVLSSLSEFSGLELDTSEPYNGWECSRHSSSHESPRQGTPFSEVYNEVLSCESKNGTRVPIFAHRDGGDDYLNVSLLEVEGVEIYHAPVLPAIFYSADFFER